MKKDNLPFILNLKNQWDYFKKQRKRNEKEFETSSLGFLTVLERETMIDQLFNFILG
jgi:hypothetical protein